MLSNILSNIKKFISLRYYQGKIDVCLGIETPAMLSNILNLNGIAALYFNCESVQIYESVNLTRQMQSPTKPLRPNFANEDNTNYALTRRHTDTDIHDSNSEKNIMDVAGKQATQASGNSLDSRSSVPDFQKDINRKSERVERIASIIRQHKEENTDKDTGLVSIPRRNTSTFKIPQSKESAKETILAMKTIALPQIKKEKPIETGAIYSVLEGLKVEDSGDMNKPLPDLVDEGCNPAAISYGESLYHGTAENFEMDKVSGIIGKGKLCEHLDLNGETQAIDRILYQVSKRYWKCNPEFHQVYRTDIVYGTLFSAVLLNTDLNTVNVSSKNHKKMTSKTFLKNTSDLILDMIEKDEEIKSEVSFNPESFKKWKKELENLLKDIYNSVKENPIVRNTSMPPMIKTRISEDEKSGEIVRSNSSWSVSTSLSSALGNTLERNQSKKGMGKSHSNILGKGNTQQKVLLEGVLIRKHLLESHFERARNRKWCKYWCVIKLHKTEGVELHMYRLNHMHTIDKEYLDMELNPQLAFGEESEAPICTPKEFILPESASRPADSPLNIGEPYNTFDESVPSPNHPIFSSHDVEYKIANGEPNLQSLIHSFAATHEYGAARPYCFSVHFADNNVFLFEAPSKYSCEAWINTINYWAARKSKEPLGGGLGNTDYGWSQLEADIKAGLIVVSPPDYIEEYKPIEEKGSFEHGRNLSANMTSILTKHTSSRSMLSDAGSISPNKSGAKKKFAKWTEQNISVRLISIKEQAQQLDSMIKQLDLIRQDIYDHEALHQPLKQLFGDSHSTSQLVFSNWSRKHHALKIELQKYTIYTNALLSPDVFLSPLMSPGL
ncbi:hypothetical protein HDV01_003313 [Terramyces sp. JEL0728]|nr:hypothetical protein HDV01_003313 [Terramyces sp. JEL0728]